MRHPFLVGMSLSAALVAANVNAMEIDKNSITTSVVKTTPTIALQGGQWSAKKDVVIMNVKLTAEEKKKILNYQLGNTFLIKSAAGKKLPTKTTPGLTNVPVLDQGKHGSCVTFANTAAVDSLLDKGDYISQLCSLELGSFIEKRSYFPSGWEGSSGPIVLNQMQEFGIISNDNQKNKTCSGIAEYPLKDEKNQGIAMSLDDYKAMSENVFKNMTWQPMVTSFQRFQWEKPEQADALLTQVKQTLSEGMKDAKVAVTFATLLPYKHCSTGACGKYHASDDTWVLADEIVNDENPEIGGHEMVIIGYDDNAVAVDGDGKKHQGLLVLRNSWGSDVGDKGNFYMSYDFFKQFVMEAQQIIMAVGQKA
jgi:C1A family cysteine protease